MRYEIDAPEAEAGQLEKLKERAEQYCVVMQTLMAPPQITTTWSIQG